MAIECICFFHQDVREEKQGTQSFIGVFNYHVVSTAPLPTLFPQFCVSTWLTYPVGEDPEFVSITVLNTDGEILSFMRNEIAQLNTVFDRMGRTQMRLIVRLQNLMIKEPGSIDVIIETDKGRFLGAQFHLAVVQEVTPLPPPNLTRN